MTRTINSHLNEQLRRRIAVMFDGDKFPTEAELCEEFSVSRMTVSKVLREITRDGLLVRTPRRGSFVRKSLAASLNHASEWLNEDYSGGLLAGAVTKTLRVNIFEYRHEFIRPMWDELAAKLKASLPGVEIEISADPEDTATADIIWASNRCDQGSPHIGSFSASEAARAAVAGYCPHGDYFAAAWPELTRGGFAGCPFSIGASVYLWNDHLAEQYYPGLKRAGARQMIDFFIAGRKRFAGELPPAIFYVFVPFLLMQLAAGGILKYDSRRGLSGFEQPEVARLLEVNREIFHSATRLNNGRIVTEIIGAMNLFLSGKALTVNTFTPTLRIIPENRCREFSVSIAPIGKYAPAVPVYMGIGRNCRDLETAAAAIGLLCGRPGQRLLARHRNNIPALREMAYSEEFLKAAPHNMKQVVATLDTASDVVKLSHFTADEAGYCRKFSHYILGKLELSDLFGNTTIKHKETGKS